MPKIDAKAIKDKLKDTLLRIYFPYAVKTCKLTNRRHERNAVRVGTTMTQTVSKQQVKVFDVSAHSEPFGV